MDKKRYYKFIPYIFFISLCIIFILLDLDLRVEIGTTVSMGASYYKVNSVPILPSILSIIFLIPLGWWLFFKRDNSNLMEYEKESVLNIFKKIIILYLVIMIFRQIILFYYHLPFEKTPIIFLITLQIVLNEKYKLKDFGLHKKNLFKNIILGIFLIIFAIIVLILIEMLIFWFIIPDIFPLLFEMASSISINWLAMIAIIFQIFCVGISEELFFRGYLFGKLDKNIKFLKASIISSIFFGFFHISWYIIPVYPFIDTNGLLFRICWTGIFGFFMCFIYKHNNSLVGPILIHGILNTIGSSFNIGNDFVNLYNFLFSIDFTRFILLIILEVIFILLILILFFYYFPKAVRKFKINV